MQTHEDSTDLEAKPVTVKRFWGPWATTGFGSIVIIASFVVQFLVVMVFLVNYFISNRRAGLSALMENVESNMGTIVSAAVILEVVFCVPIIVAFVRLRHNLPFSEYIGLRRFKAKTLLFWLVVFLVFPVAAEGIRYVFEIPESQRDVTLFSTSNWLPLFFASIVVFAPVFEEVLFRGFMFEGYANSRLGPVGAIFITAAIWAVLHISVDVAAYDILVLFLGGLLLGIARWKTGSLWVPLAMHALWNILAFISLAAATAG